ncbi:lysophosphatidic acid phosphatase type 6 [Nematocida homosporus]|uniref:lysophosphatidic acid phosphatase type 6 n=1 Tax=Nematocida homosporus TaxID=1912981 RepID=UPI0022201F37|nr:lysophosphatidic acid phosphatase type 6 [Nematocida homosporus]KAI5186320.1 lysophosphatidic acid phosphatase type 6 [Nematocida homosporus]
MTLQLAYVHLIHRHGERTPLLFGPHDRTNWNLCHRTSKISYVAPNKPHTLTDRIKGLLSYFQRKESPPVEFNLTLHSGQEFNCAPGQLTDKGRETLTKLGAWFRRRYVEKEGLISPVFKKEEFQLRSTNFQRTLESLQSLMQGLFPTHPAQMDVRVNDITADSLGISRHCPRLKTLTNQSQAALKKEFSPKADLLRHYFSKNFSPSLAALSPYAIYDLIASNRAHGFSQFRQVPRHILSTLEEYSLRLWFGHLNTQEGIALNTGALLNEISNHLVHKAADPNLPLKASIFSAHDVTVYPLLKALGSDPKAWPKFGANVIFELLKDKTSQEHYVLMRYNGQEVPIGLCKREKKGRSEVCPLEEFVRICNSFYFSDLSAECQRE